MTFDMFTPFHEGGRHPVPAARVWVFGPGGKHRRRRMIVFRQPRSASFAAALLRDLPHFLSARGNARNTPKG
jgi:hypothetical protein